MESRDRICQTGISTSYGTQPEIFSQLQSGLLNHVANLRVPQQVSDLAAWLVSL